MRLFITLTVVENDIVLNHLYFCYEKLTHARA